MTSYRHLHIRGLGQAPAQFRSRGMAPPKRPSPVGNRFSHGMNLKNDLAEAVGDFNEVAERQAYYGVPEKNRGVLIAVEGRAGEQLAPGNGRSTTRGLKLLTVQRQIPNRGETPADLATFFLTQSTVDSLNSNLEKYIDWRGDEDADELDNFFDDDDQGAGKRPNNFWLFESAAEIRSVGLRDLWMDGVERLPTRKQKASWEVWLNKDLRKAFRSAAEELQVEIQGDETEFVEVAVVNVSANPGQIFQIARETGAVLELRSASSLASDFLTPLTEEVGPIRKSLRLPPIPPAPTAARVTILDTGVYPDHPLLQSALGSKSFAADASWDTDDHSGHGTKMAGVAQFFDLASLPAGAAPLEHITRLESVVVTAPDLQQKMSARNALQRAVSLVEVEAAKRVFCLAQTARDELATGRVTATSAAVDLLAYGNGAPRLFCVAAGNVPTSIDEPYMVEDYDDRNSRFGIQSPGQAVNAITVGAITFKAATDGLVAPAGDLAPTSRTAEDWSASHPTKPDIVMEGGNFVIDDDDVFAHPSHENLILTTSDDPDQPFVRTGETSAATARASGLLGRMMNVYPNMRPESLRGLLVHVADWTPAMLEQLTHLRQQARKSKGDAWDIVLSRFGWGVPNEHHACYSEDNAVSMIIEEEITPFERINSQIRLKEMKYFRLPWPTQTLMDLRQTQVELRCTLSYFIEPDPQAVSRDRYDRYRSLGLKFDVKRPDESHEAAIGVFDQFTDLELSGGDSGWLVGGRQSRGSLHHDIWRGPAYQLAERGGISVAPVKGWWADITNAKRFDRPVKFSLIVSLKAPVGSNLFAEISANAASLLVETPTPVTV